MSNMRRTTCENCGAPYLLDASKLLKEKNKVTCRRCHHKMIIYKNIDPSEPMNEKTVVVNDDEKTQVDETPRPQQPSLPFETAVSRNPMNSETDPKILDPRVTSPEPNFHFESAEATYEISDTPRASKPLFKSEVPIAPVKEKNAMVKPSDASKKTDKKHRDLLARVRGEMQLYSGLVVVSIVAIFGQIYFVGEALPSTLVILLGMGSLSLLLFSIITSNFGQRASNLMVSSGISTVLTGVIAVVLFVNPTLLEPNVITPEIDVVQVQPDTIPEVAPPPQAEVEEKVEKEEVAPPPQVKKPPPKPKATTKKATSSRPSKSPPVKERKEKIAAPVLVDEAPEELPEPDMLPELDEEEDLDRQPSKRERKADRASQKEEPPPEPVTANVIPLNVLDIIIRSNKAVKQCFIEHRKKTGELPNNIEMLFTVQPSGKVSQAYIAEGPYVASQFEGCLRAAFKGMSFPEFDEGAKAQSLRYSLKI